MPIYIVDGDDHRQITADDLAEMLNVPKNILHKLKTNPVFEVRESLKKPDRINGGFTAPAGRMSRPVIMVKLDRKTNKITEDSSGITTMIRYATAIVPDKINPRISTYEPRRLVFNDLMDVVPNVEQALFKYLLPACKDSPIADLRNFHYTFQNKEKKASEINEKGKNISRALAFISNPVESGGLSNHQLLLVAKGLYATNRNPPIIPNPSAKNKLIEEVKADLITLALKDPDLFLSSVDDDVNEFYGMVLDAVDRGIFEIRSGGKTKGWYWASGPNKGSHITDISGGGNEFDALKGAIEANPNAFYATITRAVTEAAGKDNMSDFIKQKKAETKVGQTAAAVNQAPVDDDDDEYEFKGEGEQPGKKNVQNTPDTPPEPIEFKLPDNYPDSIKAAMVFNGGKCPAKPVLSKFWDKIKKKEVTVENIKEVLENLIADNTEA